jgi:hypothetical protein
MSNKPFKGFDPKDLIPPEKIIGSAGSHLYLIGLSHFPFGTKLRNRFCNPLYSIVLHIVFLVRALLLIFLPDEEADQLSKISGDYSDFFKVRKHLNIGLSTFLFLAIVSQIIHYRNYCNNTQPIYLKPFEMISGLIPPENIGLTEEVSISKLMRRARIIFKLNEFNSYALPLCISMIPTGIVYSRKTLFEFVFFGIPSSLLFYFCIYFTFGYQLWQISYFYLICYYLRIKLRLNNKTIESKLKIQIGIKTFAVPLMKNLYSIYTEIKSYNDNFWSKYLLSFVLIWITAMNIIVYVSIFAIMDFYLRALFIYLSITFISIYLIVINSASSVPYEAEKAYKLLNTLQVLSHKLKFPLYQRLKV